MSIVVLNQSNDKYHMDQHGLAQNQETNQETMWNQGLQKRIQTEVVERYFP